MIEKYISLEIPSCVRNILTYADRFAELRMLKECDLDCYLAAMLTLPPNAFQGILDELKVNLVELHEIAIGVLDAKEAMSEEEKSIMSFSIDLISCFQGAEGLIQEYGLDYFTPESILIPIVINKEGNLPEAFEIYLERHKMDKGQFISDTLECCLRYLLGEDKKVETNEIVGENISENDPVLSIGEDLVESARRGDFNNLIEIQPEKVDKMIETLSKQKRKNVLILGESGVGKTAIVELLANRIARGEVPENFLDKKIINLSLGSIVAGTSLRGQMESKIQHFLGILDGRDDVIVFIDEIHSIVGAGSSHKDDLDVANIFKPALSRGKLCCIGATTFDEYSRTIKKDGAMNRRFEQIKIEEPTKTRMEEVLVEFAKPFENDYGVKFSKNFLDNVVDFCDSLQPNLNYPDKLSLCLEGCASKSKGKVLISDLNDYFSEKNNNPVKKLMGEKIFGGSNGEKFSAMLTHSRYLNPNQPFFCLLGGSNSELAEERILDCLKDEFQIVSYFGAELSDFYQSKNILLGESSQSLVNRVSQNEKAVIVIRNIEEVNFNVVNLIKQILNEGRITSSNGDLVDFAQSAFIFSCGVGEAQTLGFGGENSEKTAKLPEYLSFLSENSIIFEGLSVNEREEFLKSKFKILKKSLICDGVNFSFDDGGVSRLASQIKSGESLTDFYKGKLSEITKKVQKGAKTIKIK